MSRTIDIAEMTDLHNVYQWCSTAEDPIFVSSKGKEELVLLNIDLYRKLFARAHVYQKLEEGEADVAAGHESDAFEMLNRIGRSKTRV